MHIPKKIKVGGKTYKVISPYVFTERWDLNGQVDHDTNVIKLAHVSSGETRARENIEEAFIHEMLHCVDTVYNGHALEEETVLRLSQGVYQVLKDSGMLK